MVFDSSSNIRVTRSSKTLNKWKLQALSSGAADRLEGRRLRVQPQVERLLPSRRSKGESERNHGGSLPPSS